MEIPTQVELRYHHIAMLANMYGLPEVIRTRLTSNQRYGKETADKIAMFSHILFSNPRIRIKVVERPDSICILCRQYDDKLDKCLSSDEADLKRTDDEVRSDYNLDKKNYFSGDLARLKKEALSRFLSPCSSI